MSRPLTGERRPASERDSDFGGRQRERIRRGGPGLASSQRVVPRSYLGGPSGFQEGRSAAVSRLGRPCDPIGTDLGFREHPHPRSRAKNP